jgi:hypothetical protein
MDAFQPSVYSRTSDPRTEKTIRGVSGKALIQIPYAIGQRAQAMITPTARQDEKV